MTKALTHEDYWGVVNGGGDLAHENTAIRSFGHVNKTVRTLKTSLSALDTKRWVAEDGISSLPYGHWRTADPADRRITLTDEELEEVLDAFT